MNVLCVQTLDLLYAQMMEYNYYVSCFYIVSTVSLAHHWPMLFRLKACLSLQRACTQFHHIFLLLYAFVFTAFSSTVFYLFFIIKLLDLFFFRFPLKRMNREVDIINPNHDRNTISMCRYVQCRWGAKCDKCLCSFFSWFLREIKFLPKKITIKLNANIEFRSMF